MKRFLLIAIPIAALSGLIAWRINIKRADAQQQKEVQFARSKAAPVVTVAEAIKRDVIRTVEAIGSIESPFNTRISSEVAGQITFLEAREGDPVTTGQVLVQIDASQIDSEVRQREAVVAEARARLAQATISQASTDATITQQIAHQQAAVDAAKADHKQASTNYDYLLAASKANIENLQSQVEAAEAEITNCRAAIRTAEANLANSKVRYERAKKLFDQGFVAEQAVDDARTQVAVREGELDEKKGSLEAAVGKRNSIRQQKTQAENQGVIGKQRQLAEIDASSQRVKQAEAALALAKANTAQRTAYQQNLQALRSSVASAEALLRSARSRRKDTILKSPLNGFVVSRMTDPGAVTTVGQTILTVQTAGDVWFTASVPEGQSAAVKMGASAKVKLDALQGAELSGTVVQINPSADPASRQYLVRVRLANPKGVLRSGQFGRMAIAAGSSSGAVLIPREAVTKNKEGDSVVVVDEESTAHVRPITTAGVDGNHLIVQSGVSPGDRVVTLSASPVKDGTTVVVANAESQAAK